MTAVVLGIDPQKTRLGLALVTFEAPHRALWADTLPIGEPDGGPWYQQIGAALHGIEKYIAVGMRYGPEPIDLRYFEVARVGIEQPALIGDRPGIFDAGGVFHLVLAEAHRRWPHAPQIVRQPSQWKKDALGKGNASKVEIQTWAAGALGIDFDGDDPRRDSFAQDSADALGVAVSAAMVELEERAA